MRFSAQDWLTRLASSFDMEPPSSPQEVEDMLLAAGVVAYSSERLTAPLSTYMNGRAGMPHADGRLIEGLSSDLSDSVPAAGAVARE